MLKIDGTTIYLTCGDSARFAIHAKYKTGEDYGFQAGDKVVFSLKATNKKDDHDILIVKDTIVDGPTLTAYIELVPDDTKNLEFKKYYYDVQLIKPDGWNDTIIENAIFKVGVEIG